MQFPDLVLGDEPIARFMLESSKYSSVEMRVKYTAFDPPSNPDKSNYNKLSAYRVADLEHENIVEIGFNHVAAPQGKVIKAYAVVSAHVFESHDLQLVPTEQPHPRHANVIGWTEKEANRSRAQKIAEFATLVLR